MFEKGILALLKKDHKEVRSLLAKLEETEDPRQQADLRERIAVDLRVHSRIEEEIFYPSVERLVGGSKDRSLVLQAYEEHDMAEKALDDLLAAATGTDQFRGQARVLAELVGKHADHEESEMFSHVKRNIDRLRLDELGAQAEQRRAELTGQVAAQVRATTSR